MLITRVYTGPDGKSHFEDVEIELLDQGPMGSISSLWSAKGVLFRKVSGDYDLDFHNAPRRQFVVNLTGSVEIEVGDGTKRQLGAGSILLAEDTEGQGHISRSINGEPRECLFIPLSD
tara:strand:+ start:81 stop:434 length:354 start_codon:yes stop_codon:yes gene_type:complete